MGDEQDQVDDVEGRVRMVLETVGDAFGVSAVVEVERGDGGVDARFVGETASVLVGPGGSTLDAIQHLAYRIAYRGRSARGHVSVDADGYRSRRAQALEGVADQAADAAVRDGSPVPLEPMSAVERKVVHEYLKGRLDVETYSEGEEPSRRLVVAPIVD